MSQCTSKPAVVAVVSDLHEDVKLTRLLFRDVAKEKDAIQNSRNMLYDEFRAQAEISVRTMKVSPKQTLEDVFRDMLTNPTPPTSDCHNCTYIGKTNQESCHRTVSSPKGR